MRTFEFMTRPVTFSCGHGAARLPLGIYAVWLSKDPAFQQLRDIHSLAGHRRFVGWWAINGWREYPGVPLAASFALIAELEGASAGKGQSLDATGPVAQSILEEWEYLYSRYGERDGGSGYQSWWCDNYRRYFPLLDLFVEGKVDEAVKASHAVRPLYHPTLKPLSPGATVIGMGKGVLGIGEDARRIAIALRQAGVSCSIFNFPPLAPDAAVDDRYAHLCTERLDRRANVFALPAFETLRAAGELGAGMFAGHLNIGYWQWELPVWPREQRDVFEFVDEVWTSSRYTRDAMAAKTDKPVIWMPFPVEIDQGPRGDRSYFGFDGRFAFLCVIDGNSWLKRKNPAGVIEAFQAAFPIARNEPVQLLIKAMNVSEREEWRRLLDLVAQDSRITVLDRILARDEMFGLIASADALVSLHRAEGFGRVPAEAMLLGKPVVATAYSGNVDYCKPDTAFLVDYHMVPLSAGDYPLWQGQVWAEPRIDSAAAALRECFENVTERERKARLGTARISELYSTEAAGKRYYERLKALGVL